MLVYQVFNVIGFVLSISWSTGAEYVNFLSDQYIENLNKQGLPWKAGRNFPADLTQADVERMFGGKLAGGTFLDTPSPDEPRVSHLSEPNPPPIPRDFDARKHFRDCSSIISVIPNQGKCDSSYAFSISSVASDRLCIASNGKIKKHLSAEYITACCKKCRDEDEFDVCGRGGSKVTWEWLHKRGLVTGGGYKSNIGCQPVSFEPCNHTPYHSLLPHCEGLYIPEPKCHTRCTNDNYTRGFFQDKVRFKPFYWVNKTQEDIQLEIMKHGPVVGTLFVHEDLYSYERGVYLPSIDSLVLTFIHVRIIGWGTEEFHPYWIVVPPFGDQFGVNGTIRVLRGHEVAFIESFVNAALPADSSLRERTDYKTGLGGVDSIL